MTHTEERRNTQAVADEHALRWRAPASAPASCPARAARRHGVCVADRGTLSTDSGEIRCPSGSLTGARTVERRSGRPIVGSKNGANGAKKAGSSNNASTRESSSAKALRSGIVEP